jgi:rhomboid family GlyGly-CTERM serine protease
MKNLRPVLLLPGPALAVRLAPAAAAALIYDRSAILRGGWWRLWTGHWVHFSSSHLAWNLAVAAGAGLWLERLQPGWLPRYLLAGAPLISVALLLAEPAMQAYGGLSALATGLVVLLALAQLVRPGAERARWWAVLLLVAAKTAFDCGHPEALFARFDVPGIRASATAHAAGALTALAFFLSRGLRFCLPLTRAAHPASSPSSASR